MSKKTKRKAIKVKGKWVWKDRGEAVKKVNHQTGKTNIKRDSQWKALPPGKRISKNKKVYYEYRKNRSDLKKNT